MITVGQRLREERVKKDLSVEEVARATKIRTQFIRNIEDGNFTGLPSSAYALGFVKNYVAFLGLPSRELLAKFRREYDAREHRVVLPESLTSRTNIRMKKIYWGKYSLISCVIIIPVLFYIFFQYRGFFFGPSLSVVTPREHAVLQASEIVVEGSTDINSTLIVNTVPTFVDSSGHFRKLVNVFSGNDRIVVKTVNSFGKSREIVRDIVVKD